MTSRMAAATNYQTTSFQSGIKDTIDMVDNVPVISIKGLILMKQEIGRDKDKKDIALIGIPE